MCIRDRGIGGGIFLSPIMFLIRAGKPRDIITTASLFILINSIFGIAGQLTKNAVLMQFQAAIFCTSETNRFLSKSKPLCVA